MIFEWDEKKNIININKHSLSFDDAQLAFYDPKHLIIEDDKHSKKEKRHFCIGKVDSGIITVRFTYRENKIRIIGAGFWRDGKVIYEEKN